MAKIKSGIVGNLKGNIAEINGGVIHSKGYIRSRFRSKSVPGTIKQQQHQAKFSTLSVWIKSWTVSQIPLGLAKAFKHMDWRQAAFKINLPVMTGFIFTWLDNAKIMKGPLLPVTITGLFQPPVLPFIGTKWIDNSNGVNAFPNDVALGIAFNVRSGKWINMSFPLTRSDELLIWDMGPDTITGDGVFFKLFFHNPERDTYSDSASFLAIMQ